MNPIRDKRLYESNKLIQKNSTHLDIGSGSFPINNKAITIDIQKTKYPNINATAIRLPIYDSCIDIVSCFEIIEHFHNKEQLLFIKEINRILKFNGQLIISIPNSSSFMKIPQQIIWWIREHTTQQEYHNNKYTHTHIGLISPKQLITLLEHNKFRILESRRLMLYDYIIKCQKRN